MDEITEINISGKNCDIIFHPSETTELQIKEYVSSNKKKESFVNATTNGSTLDLIATKDTRTFMTFGNNYRYFEVYLPTVEAETITLATASGYINCELPSAQSFTFEAQTNSGDITFKQ